MGRWGRTPGRAQRGSQGAFFSGARQAKDSAGTSSILRPRKNVMARVWVGASVGLGHGAARRGVQRDVFLCAAGGNAWCPGGSRRHWWLPGRRGQGVFSWRSAEQSDEHGARQARAESLNVTRLINVTVTQQVPAVIDPRGVCPADGVATCDSLEKDLILQCKAAPHVPCPALLPGVAARHGNSKSLGGLRTLRRCGRRCVQGRLST